MTFAVRPGTSAAMKRNGRERRRPQGRPGSTEGQIRDMVMISQRPTGAEETGLYLSIGSAT